VKAKLVLQKMGIALHKVVASRFEGLSVVLLKPLKSFQEVMSCRNVNSYRLIEGP